MKSWRVLSASAAAVSVAVVRTVSGQCEDSEFECNDGRCIPLTWKCDYEADCNGGEDEDGCKSCEEVGYMCRTTEAAPIPKCIPIQWKCDDWNDCPLRDDELFCADCDETQGFFACADGECIDAKRRCDYTEDCYNGEDELDCPYATCEDDPESYKCDNNQTCIAQHKLCDGHVDCNDAYDECKCGNSSIECVEPPTFPPTTPSPADRVPVWKWCSADYNMQYLGFSTSKESGARNQNVSVFWTKPSLRPTPYFSVATDSGHKPGDQFIPDRYFIDYYTSCEHLSHDSDEYSICQSYDPPLVCTVTLLVFWNMSAAELDTCKGSAVSYRMSLTSSRKSFAVQSIADHSGADDGDDVTYYSNTKYLQADESEGDDVQSHKCYAAVKLVPHSSDSSSSSDPATEMIEWMVAKVWPLALIIVILVGLICFVVGCLLFLYKKTQEYEAMEFDDELSSTYSATPEEMYDPMTGTYAQDIHGRMRMNRQKRVASQMHTYGHLPVAGTLPGMRLAVDPNSVTGPMPSFGGAAVVGGSARRFSEQLPSSGGVYASGGGIPTRADVELWKAETQQRMRRNSTGSHSRFGAAPMPSTSGMLTTVGSSLRGAPVFQPPAPSTSSTAAATMSPFEARRRYSEGREHVSSTSAMAERPSAATAVMSMSTTHSPSPLPASASGKADARDSGRRASILGVSLEEIAELRKAEETKSDGIAEISSPDSGGGRRKRRRRRRRETLEDAAEDADDDDDVEQQLMEQMLDEHSVVSASRGL